MLGSNCGKDKDVRLLLILSEEQRVIALDLSANEAYDRERMQIQDLLRPMALIQVCDTDLIAWHDIGKHWEITYPVHVEDLVHLALILYLIKLDHL